jgi:hypothetical protein
VSCFPIPEPTGPLLSESYSRPQDPDCVVASLAHANFELNKKKKLQDWYNEIKSCAVALGLYHPRFGVKLEDVGFIETLCKAPISAGINEGNPETFTIIERTPANPNPLDCPPLNPGDRVTAVFISNLGPTPPNVIPIGTAHQVSCVVNPTCTGLDCSDRVIVGGRGVFFEYSVNIDPQGQASSPGNPIHSTTLQRLSRPNP